MSERSFSQGPLPLIVAHRGAPTERPENTLAAFEAAVDAGAAAVEFDVRITADGSPVVIHDATLDRTTGDIRRVADVMVAHAEGSLHQWFNLTLAAGGVLVVFGIIATMLGALRRRD